MLRRAQAALKQANRRAEDLRAAAAAAEARERDSAAQVDRANGIIERLTVRVPTSYHAVAAVSPFRSAAQCFSCADRRPRCETTEY